MPKSGLRAALSVALMVAAAGVPLAAIQGPASAQSRDVSAAGLPIMKYWIADSVVSQLQEARDELALRCMASLGFTAVSAQYGEVSASAGTSLFPAVTRSASGQVSYVPVNSPGPATLVAHSPVTLVNRAPARAEDTSMYGRGKNTAVSPVPLGRIPAGGCWGQAGRILYGSHPALPADPRAVAVESQAYAMQAPATQAALARWSACMSRAGQRYAAPLQAALDPRGQTASADLACRGQVDLQQVFQNAEAQYQTEQLASHLPAIQQSLGFVSDWLRNARNAGVSLAAPQPESASVNDVTGLNYFTGPVTYTDANAPGERLDLWHSGTTDGNKVDIYPINGGNAQKWLYSNVLSNGCRILAPYLNENYAVQDPSGSLAYNVGANIWFYGSSNTFPTWYTVNIPNAPGYGSGYYVIQNCRDWLYLTAPFSAGAGAQLTWSPGSGGPGAPGQNQVWF